MVLPANLSTNLAVGDPLPSSLNATRTAINQLKGEVEDRIPFPPGAAIGDMMVWDGDEWVTTLTRFLEGDGRPEGNVSAPIGSRYMDTSGAEGAVEWVKAGGGTGVTGWVNMVGDTGRRNIASLINKPAGCIVHRALVRRINSVVDMHLELTMPNANGTWELLTELPGFGPGYDKQAALQDNSEAASTGGTLVTASGGVKIFKTLDGKKDNYTGTWLTGAAWPADLPGVAAT